MKVRLNLVNLLVATSGLALASGACAQSVAESAPDRGLEEIVVTARRQSESLVRVPAAVTALAPADLQRNHATDLMKIAELTPQVLIQRSTSGNGAIFSIRGVGSSYLDAGVEQSVLVNIDNVPITRGRISNASQFDVGQVEILKGPQALFFGKNSPAGVISLTSANPTEELSGYVRAGYEFEARERYVEAAISGPLTDTLTARIAGKYDKIDGWIKNVATGYATTPFSPFPVVGPSTGRAPANRSIAGRLTLLWKPSSDFSANFKLLVSDDKGNGEDAAQEPYCLPGVQNIMIQNILTGAFVTDTQNDCKVNGRRALGRFPDALVANWPGLKNGKPFSYAKAIFGSLQLNWNVGNLALTSITGYTRLRTGGSAVGDTTSFASVFFANFEKSRSWSQEFRAVSDFEGPLNFSAGAFLADDKRLFTNGAHLAFVGPDPVTGRFNVLDVRYDNSGKTYSAFGQLRWAMMEDVEIAGGVRYTREKKDLVGGNTYTHSILGPAFGLAPVGQVIRPKFRDSNWSPEITASYHPTRNSTVYVAYKTGYKSGGFSNTAVFQTNYVTNPSALTFGAERAKGFEGGVKGEFFDRTLRAEVIAYRYNFDGLQLSVFDPQLVSYSIRNAAKARTTGIEGSLNWRATQELQIRAAGSLNRAKYVSFPAAACYAGQTAALGCVPTVVGTSPAQPLQDRSGQSLPRAPRRQFSGGFSYDSAFSSSLYFGVTGDAVYTSKYLVIDNGDPRVSQNAYWRINASMRVYTADEKIELAVIGRNLTNKYYKIAYNDIPFGPVTGGQLGGVAARPREVVVQLQYKF